MKCPKCQRNNDRVYGTENAKNTRYQRIRYRKCLSCGYRYKTVERIDYKSMDSKVKCTECDETLYPGEFIYGIEDMTLCRKCALEWLESFETEVTEEQAYGGEDV